MTDPLFNSVLELVNKELKMKKESTMKIKSCADYFKLKERNGIPFLIMVNQFVIDNKIEKIQYINIPDVPCLLYTSPSPRD